MPAEQSLWGRAEERDLRYNTCMPDPLSDPLAWRHLKAPSLAEIEVLAGEIFRHLPRRFRDLCVDLVIQVDDFPSDEVLDQMDAESEFDLLGLFQGVGLPFRTESAPMQMPNMIWLYRRPILDYWAEHDETLGAIVRHVLVHEIGHHFGLSDADMAAIEETAEETKGAVSRKSTVAAIAASLQSKPRLIPRKSRSATAPIVSQAPARRFASRFRRQAALSR